ncbi:unnamed protein product, partial [Effrenium voratum]
RAAIEHGPEWMDWRFGAEEWGVMHLFAAVGATNLAQELLVSLTTEQQHQCVNLQDCRKNTPLHLVPYYMGCILVSGSGEPLFHGCYFPHRDFGSLCYKKMGFQKNSFIRIAIPDDDDKALQWRFEDSEWYWPYISRGKKAHKEEVPVDSSCWDLCESNSRTMPSFVYKDIDQKCHSEMVATLIDNQADVLRRNDRGRTPLMECLHRPVSRASHKAQAELCLEFMGMRQSDTP